MGFAFNMSMCNFKARTLNHTTREQKLVCAVGKVAKLGRQVVVFVVYVPPSSSAAYVAALAESLAMEIAAVKSAIKDPLIYVCGDFNCRDIGRELAVAGDLQPLPVGHTRGGFVLTGSTPMNLKRCLRAKCSHLYTTGKACRVTMAAYMLVLNFVEKGTSTWWSR